MMKPKEIYLSLCFLQISLFVVLNAQCPYGSFTWVAHQDDNPYFWKSPSFDWNATSVLGVFGDITDSQARTEMRDYAQSLGVIVQTGVGPNDIDMNDETQREERINQIIAQVKDQGLNGVNIDYEGHDPRKTEGFNDFAVELCIAMHDAIPNSSVSVDVPIYPEYEGRNYSYARIAESCDTLFIMGYDGEFWDNVQCAVTPVNCSLASASLQMLELGVQQYLSLGVPASSLFLGVPWYGLQYEYVAGIPFFTGQIHYNDILDIISNAGSSGKSYMDSKSSTWIFDCGGKCSQWSDQITDRTSEIWYDDPTSLAPKYSLVSKYGLQGAGMWEATHVNYDPDGDSPDADAMWNALCQRDV